MTKYGILIVSSQGEILFINSHLSKELLYIFNTNIIKGMNLALLKEFSFFNRLDLNIRQQINTNFFIEAISNYDITCISKILNEEKNNRIWVIELSIKRTNYSDLVQEETTYIDMLNHELRAPASSIYLASQDLTRFRNELNQEQVEHLQEIISVNAKLMTELIDNVLDLSQLDEHKLRLKFESHSIKELLADVLLQLELKTSSKQLDIQIFFDHEYVVMVDKLRMEQILRILIDNAIKFSKNNDRINIRLESLKDEVKTYLQIQIEDFGIGIKENDQKNIFQRFYRSEDIVHVKGTGLGLSIAKQLVELHDGRISFSSIYGKGSIFKIAIPIDLSNKKF